MGRRVALSRTLVCRRGVTLLEVVVCLAVLALFVTGFVRHLGGTAAADARLEERARAAAVARALRALLAAEDPWAAPALRSVTLDGSATPVRAGRAGSYDVRITGSVVCAGGTLPLDAPALAPPGGCPGGQPAVRRWRVAVRYLSLHAAAGRDSVVTVLDADAGPVPSITPFDGSLP